MISHNPYSKCSHARLYYYDFLNKQTRESIPESTLDHIVQCWDCQAEIDRLETMLSSANKSTEREQSGKDSAISTLLKLHFAYIGDPVQCNMVKPFLPSLADPALQIRIPTPITRHVEKCRACSDALTSVRELHLAHTQLCRLGRLLADDPAESTVSCAQAQEAIPAVASMAFQQIEPEILKHVCLCPDCRRQLYLRREANRQKLLRSETPQDKSSCEVISASDIYDCTFPYGLDPATNRFAESCKALIAHVQSCPVCLAKMQELHHTVSGIAERPESGVVTVYHLDEPADVRPVGGSVEITAGAPAKADENNTHRQGTRTIDFVARFKQIISAPSTKRLLKTGLAAAAIILIGLALLFNAPTASAVTVESIYNALEKVRSVYIANFTGHGTEPALERWASYGLKTYLIKQNSQWTLSDIGASLRKSKDSRTGISKEVRLNEDDLAGLKEAMSRTLDFMPFQKLSDVPPDAQWNRVTDAAVQSGVPGTEVYDLMWTDSTSASVIHNKWRAFVDPGTNLPLRSELYQKRPVDSEYSLTSVKQIRYITDAEIEAVIAGVSF